MMPTSAHGITLEHILDPRSAWKINHAGNTIRSYTFMRRGHSDVTITKKGLVKIDPRLPDILVSPEIETTIMLDKAGLIVRANMQLWNDLAPKSLGNLRICEQLHDLYEISRVVLIDAQIVKLSGHFLQVDRTSREYPFVTDIDYMRERFVPAAVLNELLPGSIDRMSLLESLGTHPALIMLDIFSKPSISEALPLPDSITTPA